VEEVGGAVERIDEPTELRTIPAFFLAEHRDLGLRGEEVVTDRALARGVDLAHPVARALQLGMHVGPECAAHDLTTGARGTDRELAQGVEIELARHVATIGRSCSSSSGVDAAT